MDSQKNVISYKQLTAFFLPLAFSASLTAISHVIINGTLSRGEDAAFIIACYAVAFSLFGIVEKPMIVFRQTSSALVEDHQSFKQLFSVFFWVTIIVMTVSMVIGFTSIGDWIFVHLFNADENMVNTISLTFRWISVVIFFSGIRGIYQGVIIRYRDTKWLTIGVIVRLTVMFMVSFWFVSTERVDSMTGAAIFLIGMVIECIISAWKGNQILRRIKLRKEAGLKKSVILPFYLPLVFYSFIQTFVQPVIYIFLSQSENIELSIASFALAFTVSQLMLSFFMYTHQIVLQFYKTNRKKVIRFNIILSLVPALLLSLISFTPLGKVVMEGMMGAEPSLAGATLFVLPFFIVKVMVFPWVDFFNGFVMLQRRTSKMVYAQLANIVTVCISLYIIMKYFPYLNGAGGAIAASLGELTGLLAIIMIILRGRGSRLSKTIKRSEEGYS